MATYRNVYENPSVSGGIELKGFKSQKKTEVAYYSTIDDVNDSVTKVEAGLSQQGNVKDVKIQVTEKVTSSIPPYDSDIKGKNGSNSKSNVKLVIILIFVMIAIATASSTVSTLLFKKDLKIIQEEVSANKQDTLKDSVAVPTIMFKAKTVSNEAPTDGQVLVFTTNLVNKGEGYDNSTGVFIAPVTGLYDFTVQICTYPTAKITISLLVDDNAILLNTIGGAKRYVFSSADASAEMNKGSKARVVAYNVFDTFSDNLMFSNNIYRINAFSGLLIHL